MIVNTENFYKVHGFDSNLAIIKLNGKEVCDVVMLNESEGWLEKYVTDENGDYKINDDRNSLITERIFGQVSVNKKAR